VLFSYHQDTKIPPGPLKKKFESATFETVEAFLRKTVADTFVQVYAAVDEQVDASAKQYDEKKQKMRVKAQTT
jgi:hypothetical protein